MRIKVHLRGSGVLPFDYHRHLNAAMYEFKRIADENLSAMLHYSKGVKIFTFSEIMVPRREIVEEGIKILDGYAYLVYSSPSTDYVRALVTGMLSSPEMRVGDLNFRIEGIEVLEEPDVDWRNLTVKTLSPVVVSTRDEKGKKVFLYPSDTQWYVNLEKNIRHKYREFYGVEPTGRIEVKVIHSKPKKYTFRKGTREGAIKAVHGRFILRGSPEIIRFAYQAGLGERGAQGFGCVDVIGNSNKRTN